MNNKVFVSCAVTGSGDTASKHPDLPKTPEQIATASIEAAKAGADLTNKDTFMAVIARFESLIDQLEKVLEEK